MAKTGPRYSKEEFARRGDTIYERDIAPHLKPADEGKYVAIDIETGEYEIDPDSMAASRRLRGRIPDSQTWMVRVGYRGICKFGGRSLGLNHHHRASRA